MAERLLRFKERILALAGTTRRRGTGVKRSPAHPFRRFRYFTAPPGAANFTPALVGTRVSGYSAASSVLEGLPWAK